MAGGSWPDRGRHAALKLSGVEGESQSIGVELLSDIKEAFTQRRIDKISTVDLISALCDDDESPWSTYNRGKPITPRQVSRRLHEYDIKSKTVRIGYATPKGFEIEQFNDAFSRYLGDLSATPQQTSNDAPYSVTHEKSVAATPATPLQDVSDNPQRCGNENESETLQPTDDAGCCGVADKTGKTEENDDVEIF
jgi:putative DNA primase/helicase